MALSKLESQIIERIALSPKRLSAYDFQDIGWYPNIHKTCKKLVTVEVLEYDYEKNEKGSSKKVFRLTDAGFYRFVDGSDLFTHLNLGSYYPDDKFEQVTLLLERWKHLHEGVGCFYNLLMKFRNLQKKTTCFNPYTITTCPNGVTNEILSVFLTACRYNCSLRLCWHEQKIAGNDVFDSSEQQFHVLNVFIDHAMKLPRETNGFISYEDVVEIFKDTTSGMNILNEAIETELFTREGLDRCRQKYF